ncbi:hypothetical protein FQA39_LY11081 [Lamprigera yunnana]|nr:hypothetical protein FQA39_LY11081 [Lamprigera yunnana]
METTNVKPKTQKTNAVEANPFLSTNRDNNAKNGGTLLRNLHLYFCQFCGATSIHGIQYLGERGRYIVEKLVWIAIITTVSGLCLFLISKTYVKWQTSPVIVTFSTTEIPISNIPFPAVTICPQTKFDPNKFNFTGTVLKKLKKQAISQTEENLFNTLSLSCNSIMEFIDLFGMHGVDKTLDHLSILFFASVAPPLDPTGATSVRWLGKELEIEDSLSATFTSEGICYTFNMLPYEDILSSADDFVSNNKYEKHSARQWSLQDGYDKRANFDTYPRRTFLPGISGGLMVDALYTNHSHLDYLCDESLQGYKVIILHHPSELPDMGKHFRLSLDEAVYVGIKPTMITVSPALLPYSPEKRKCYFAEEKPLLMYKLYTQQNCLSECLANFTLLKCGCLAFYMPTFNNTPICGAGSLTCILESKVKYLESSVATDIGGEKCGCLPSCTSLSYEVETSQAVWNWREMFNVFIALGMSDSVPSREESHFSRLVVYYKDLQFLTSERNELYGYVDFFSNVGGLLGLFIGFSVTSVVEIIYFLTLRLVCNVKMYGKKYWSGEIESLKAE